LVVNLGRNNITRNVSEMAWLLEEQPHPSKYRYVPYLGPALLESNIVLSIPQLIRMWRFINTTDLGSISSINLAVSMGSKNGAVDVFALGFVVTLPFHEIGVGDSSVSFIVCIAEFIHIRHTNRGDSKHDLISITDTHTVFIQTHRASYTCT
jgi:hypothetical protein